MFFRDYATLQPLQLVAPMLTDSLSECAVISSSVNGLIKLRLLRFSRILADRSLCIPVVGSVCPSVFVIAFCIEETKVCLLSISDESRESSSFNSIVASGSVEFLMACSNSEILFVSFC